MHHSEENHPEDSRHSKVSSLGSLVGFAYGFAVGTLMGASIGWIHNKIVYLRNGK